MAEHPSEEWREFVDGSVPLDEAQRKGADPPRSPFEALADRVTGAAGPSFHFSILTGAGLLLVAAGLAALMPASVGGSFWRVGREEVAGLLIAGNGASLPLALGALALVLLAGLAATTGGQVARGLLITQPFIGGAGLVGVGALWAGVLAFAVLNTAVFLLIIVIYIVTAIVIVAAFIGVLIGLVTE